MDSKLAKIYREFRERPASMLVGQDAIHAMRSARIWHQWKALEDAGLVRLEAQDEDESYFDVTGEPDNERERAAIIEAIERYGNYCVIGQFLTADGWEDADSIGHCAGYHDVLDPHENCYIVDICEETMKARAAYADDTGPLGNKCLV